MNNIKVKVFKQKTWLLIFRHSTRKTVSFFTKETAKLNNEEDKFSIIGKIDSTFKYGSKYEFMLEYPETKKFLIWRQNLSPIEHTEDGTAAAGYEPLHLIPDSNTFAGLQLSATIRALIDGDARTANWAYAIGSDGTQYSPSFPCYAGSCREVNLFVRIHPFSMTCKYKKTKATSIYFIVICFSL